MKHHFCNSHGDSQICLEQPILVPCYQRILQGNGAAPTTWVLISTPLLNMLREAQKGGKFTSPITKNRTHIVGYAYVDDMDIISMNNQDINLTADEVMEDMQLAIDIWEGGLKATGGAIVPKKSWVYPINFTFDNKGQWHYQSADDIGVEFTVQDHQNIQNTLNTFGPSVGKEILGVILSPDGNNNNAVKAMKNKATEWKDLVQSGHLKRHTAWQALETTIMKTMEYPLPALTLTATECNSIMQPILKAALPKTSISQSFPRKVLYGPLTEGGLGLNSLYYTQGTMHLEKFQILLGTSTMTNSLLQVSMESTQLEVGIGQSIFQLDFQKYGLLLTDCWLKHLWSFTQSNNIILIDRFTNFPTPQRENDVFLMEVMVHEGFSKTKLLQINRCRLYLGVLTVSDIMNGYGNGFNSAYKGDKDNTRHSPFNWPRQEKPGAQCIKIWKSALRQTFGLRQGRTQYTLGKWFYKPSNLWRWYYSPATTHLYQRFGIVWQIWSQLHVRDQLGSTPKFRYFSNCINLPSQIF